MIISYSYCSVSFQNLWIQGFLQQFSHMPGVWLIAHLQSHFHECLLLPLGCCQLFSPNSRHDDLSLGSVRGSQVCRKFERIKVKILSLQIRAWLPHSKHTKPFWKRWLLKRSCNVQTAMNLSMFDQEFQPGLLAKEYANVCPALKQRKKHLVIAHSQQKWLWKCSPLSWGAALRSEGSREHREGAKMDCWILVLCCHEPSPTSATLERLFPLALLPMLDVAQVSP